MGKITAFVIAKCVAEGARNYVLKAWAKRHEDTARQMLNGFSVDEFMKATPEEIRKGK